MFKSIENHSSLMMLLGIIMGLLFPQIEFFDWLMLPFLFAMMFLACLKLNYQDFHDDLKNLPKISIILFTRSILFPLIFYFLLKQIFPNYSLGILLIVFTPVAVAGPALTSLFRGKTSLSIIQTIGTSIIANFSIPLALYFLESSNIKINPASLGFTIFLVVILPIIVSRIIQKINQKFIEKTKIYYNSITVLLFFFFYWITIGFSKEIITEKISQSILLASFHFFIIYLFLLGALLISYKFNYKEKISVAVSFMFSNGGLVLGLSTLYFSPETTYFLIISGFTWALNVAIWEKIQPIVI